MAEIPLPQGPKKRLLIDKAYAAIGISASVFGRSSAEYVDALCELNLLMYEHPFNQLGYVQPIRGEGDLSEESGVDNQWATAVIYELASRLAPTKGKTMSAETRRAYRSSKDLLNAQFSIPAEVQFPSKTLAGRGRYRTHLAEPTTTDVDTTADPGDLAGIVSG